MVLYIVIGFCAFSSLFVIGDRVDPVGVKYVLAGNGAYIMGLILFAIGAKKKYFHTIFHIFVIIGATIHFINLSKGSIWKLLPIVLTGSRDLSTCF